MVGKKRAVESDGMSKRAIAELYRYRSTYRLGDLIYGYIDQRHGRSPLTNPPRSIYCSTWPTSLGCAFVRSNASADTRGSGLKTLCHLARDMQPRLRPRPSSLVVHLRLGDVLDYSYWREQRAGGGCSWRKGCWYVHPVSSYQHLAPRLPKDLREVVLVGNPAYRLHSRWPTNYSRDYVNRVADAFRQLLPNAKLLLRMNGTADDDFLFVARAAYLIPARGSGFGKAAAFCARRAGATILQPA